MSSTAPQSSASPAMPSSLVLLLILLASAAVGGFDSIAGGGGGREALSDYVTRFETLHYDARALHGEHIRHKRSAVEDDHRVKVDFFSHGRRFQLELQRDHSVFHDEMVVVRGDGEEDITQSVDTSHLYHGKVRDDPSSHCFGSIRDGVFDGQIHTREGAYYVERVQKYSATSNDLIQRAAAEKQQPRHKSNATAMPPPHSVIYHEKDISDPYKHRRNVSRPPGCGVSDDVKKWMESVQASGEEDPEEEVSARKERAKREAAEAEAVVVDDDRRDPSFKYSPQANDPKVRVKRARENPNKRKSCSLYIQTDPLFWRHIREQEGDDAKTEEEILSLIAQHVKAVNRIYSDTPFDGKYKHNGYQFEVQRIKIHNDSKCGKALNQQQQQPSKGSASVSSSALLGSSSPHLNPLCIPNVDVSNFLNLHSQDNHEEFCLAYIFTYRDFTGGTLGLAWVASASGASGGICETYKRYTENIDGHHRTAKRSLNTGIITFVNYNSRVPPKVSQLTLAHEIGHNFGSPHDWPEECRPGGVAGNYIMFASATSGDRNNNNKFSHCSKSNISAVLDAITDGRKPNCFTESNGAFCGNKIVEEGEECDCGFDDTECTEQCCFPRKSARLSDEDNKRNRCKRKPDTECSPSEGPCCSQQCRFLASWDTVQCKGADDCTEASFCDGRQAQCPTPAFKRDNVTECNEGTQVCQAGECKSSICVKYGLESCFLTSELVSDKRELCELACREPGRANNHTCMSTKELVEKGLIRDLDEGLSLRPGSPCDNFQGYCDVFLKCRKVDAEGPLVRLKNLLFNQETLISIAQWVTEYWYLVLLSGIGIVIIMAICIRCFAIHTPSSNPNLPKNLHITETLRRPVRASQKQAGVSYVGSWVIQNNVPPKHYRQANSSAGVAPPPYPGRGGGGGSSSGGGGGSSGGPGHGYGEGRGHYNRSRGYDPGPMGGGGPHPDEQRSRGDRRSGSGQAGYRSSRIEMQPMR